MILRTETGYNALVPDLPGCVAAAKSWKGIGRLIAEAIGLHIDSMEKHGEKVPPPSQRMEFAIDHDEPLEEYCTWVEVIPAEQTLARYKELKKSKEPTKEPLP